VPQKLHLFDFAGVGVVIAIFAILYMAVASKYLLPDNSKAEGAMTTDEGTLAVAGKRQYVVTFQLAAKSPMVGHAISRSGITTARDVTFVCVKRGKDTLPFVGDLVLQAHDEYVLATSVSMCALFRDGVDTGHGDDDTDVGVWRWTVDTTTTTMDDDDDESRITGDCDEC
jgi:hypothetical protein